MQFFVIGKIGERRSTTPEGFLICHDVPLARTGEQLYRPYEVPQTIKPKPGTDYIRVQRDADEVFHPNAIASAEGKPVTIDHPPGMEVTPSNYRAVSHGHVQNVHRGQGAQADLLIGDLVVKSREGIEYAQPGTEISMGYDSGYLELGEEADLPSGLAKQYGIIFNHAAMLDAGRCGPRCSIGDQTPPEDLFMAKTNDKRGAGIIERLRSAFSTNDGRAIETTLADVQAALNEGSEGGDGTVIINNHIPSALTGDSAPSLEGAPPWFLAYAKTTDAKFNTLGGAFVKVLKVLDAKAKDEDDDDDSEEEKERKKKEREKEKNGDRRTKDKKGGDDDDDDKDEEKKRKKAEDEQLLGQLGIESPDDLTGTGDAKKVLTGDSGFLETSFAATIAAAEILAPGIRVPTFDSAAKPGVTFDQICGLRRKALDYAMKDAATGGMVELITNGKLIDTGKATCNDVRSVFNAAVAMKKTANIAGAAVNDRRSTADQTGARGSIKSLADLNRHNAERFARKTA